MTVALVHGVPETARLWDPLRERLGVESVALSLPGFGTARPAGFGATKEEYARWLADELRDLSPPVDVVGHDWGALFTLRVVTHDDVEVRSWAVDVAELFHPDARWHGWARTLQTPGEGEEWMRAAREAPPDSPESFAGRLARTGVPLELAQEIGAVTDRAHPLGRAGAAAAGSAGDRSHGGRGRQDARCAHRPPGKPRPPLDVAGSRDHRRAVAVLVDPLGL
jgi:pimeloyl-ACP methyl ester carboxylesterase